MKLVRTLIYTIAGIALFVIFISIIAHKSDTASIGTDLIGNYRESLKENRDSFNNYQVTIEDTAESTKFVNFTNLRFETAPDAQKNPRFINLDVDIEVNNAQIAKLIRTNNRYIVEELRNQLKNINPAVMSNEQIMSYIKDKFQIEIGEIYGKQYIVDVYIKKILFF